VSGDGPHRIVAIELDAGSIVRWSAEVEHERRVAIFDLLERNHFRLEDGPDGPYRLVISLRETTLVLDIEGGDGARVELGLAMRPFRRLIKDYFLICESYHDAIRQATPRRIEAIDMARRGLHDEGSTMLREALGGRARLDHDTARRLFTLVCVLHIRG
jgi:uncharacterized protein (UPF0262 family)